jgi:hypothetical protein
MYLIIYLFTIIKPPYKQVLIGVGWIAGGPREMKARKEEEKMV